MRHERAVLYVRFGLDAKGIAPHSNDQFDKEHPQKRHPLIRHINNHHYASTIPETYAPVRPTTHRNPMVLPVLPVKFSLNIPVTHVHNTNADVRRPQHASSSHQSSHSPHSSSSSKKSSRTPSVSVYGVLRPPEALMRHCSARVIM